jgi:hypothetical protein
MLRDRLRREPDGLKVLEELVMLLLLAHLGRVG